MCISKEEFNKKFEAVKASPDNFADITEICDRYLGPGLYTEASLSRIIEDKRSHFYLIKDKNTGDAVSIFYFHYDTFDNIRSRYPYIKESLCGIDETVGILRSIAIKEQYRSIGLSEYLINRFSDQLFCDFGVSRIFVLAWVKQNYIPARHCLGNCGFSELYRVKRPWYNEEGLKCNICNCDRCICDGLLYTKVYKEKHKKGLY